MIKSDINVQKLVVAKMLRNKKALEKVCSIAHPSDFEHKQLKQIFIEANNYFTSYNKKITCTELLLTNKKRCELFLKKKRLTHKEKKDIAKGYKIRRTLIRNLYDMETFASVGECIHQFQEYKSEKDFGNAIWDALDVYERTGNTNKAREILLNNINKSYTKNEFIYSDYLENWEYRQEQRLYLKNHPEKQVVIPTGYRSLDRIIKGVMPGELFSCIATTGRGKSIFLMQQAYIALLYGFDVIYVALENSLKQIEQRLDARISKIKYDSLRDLSYGAKELRVANHLFDTLRKEISKKIHIYFIPQMMCTTDTLVRVWQDSLRKGVNRHRCLMVTDYLDLVLPTIQIKEKRLADAHVYRTHKSFLTQEEIPGWTASQTNKEVETKIAYASAIAEAYEKARIADGLVSLNQDEVQIRVGEGTLWAAKMRDHPADFPVPIIMDKAYMAIREDRAKIKSGLLMPSKAKGNTVPTKS